MKTWAENLFRFYTELHPPEPLPNNIQWLFPQKDTAVLDIVKQFLQKFYNDTSRRTLLLGINPGRFGAGITGVNFTAPLQLQQILHIPHPFKNGSEISAEFIYKVIEEYGGPESFYKDFFIGSVCPLGFMQSNKNLNYYDDKELQKTIEPFIIHHLSKLISFHTCRSRCFCIGGEKNFRYLASLNQRYQWFESIEPLPHPRFIMQYKRKNLNGYIDQYLESLKRNQEPGF